jgi:hypothetical protein
MLKSTHRARQIEHALFAEVFDAGGHAGFSAAGSMVAHCGCMPASRMILRNLGTSRFSCSANCSGELTSNRRHFAGIASVGGCVTRYGA